jgi:hypothetical protein
MHLRSKDNSPSLAPVALAHALALARALAPSHRDSMFARVLPSLNTRREFRE